MVKETELVASLRNSGENGVASLKELQPLPLAQMLFKLPQPDDDNNEDDDGNDCVSLRDWQPEKPASPSVDANGTSYSAWQPVKGSVRTRPISYTPLVKANGEVNLPPSIHGGAHTKQLPSPEPEESDEEEGHQNHQHDNDHDNGTEEDGLYDALEDELRSTKHVREPEEKDHRPLTSHHQHNISLANGIAPPPSQRLHKGGIAFDISHHQHNISLVNGIAPSSPQAPTGGIAFDITFDDQDNSLPRRSTGSSRGSSRRVSFITGHEAAELDSPSPPRSSNNSRSNSKSPYRSRQNLSKSLAKDKPGKPSWESSTKVETSAPPMPKKVVRPTLHGIKVKKGEGGVVKTAMRASLTSAEIENGFAREGRSRVKQVARSWDPQQYCGGGEYDSVSQLISKSLVSSTEETKEDSRGFSSKSVLPRSNGVHKQNDNGLQNGSKGLKPVVSETNKLTGEFGKLFNKLRRASAPLSKPSSKPESVVASKVSSLPVLSKMPRANSAPVENSKSTTKKPIAPLLSLDSSGANQKYTIGSYASLKLLQECAQTEQIPATPARTARKPRKTRDHEPHRHYYKTISKSLDSKLK